MGRRTHAYARAAYGWAVKRGLLSANPFASVALEGREKARDRALSDAELGEIWRAAGSLGWPFEPFVRILMLTLQRVAETAGMRSTELSPDNATWTIAAERAKNGKAHLVHLAEPARSVLAGIPRHQHGLLIFTTTGRTPLSGFAHAKARLDTAIRAERARVAAVTGVKPAPLIPWRLHDFRRTGVTRLAELNVPPHVADRLLNHIEGSIGGVAAVYQRAAFLPERRAALEIWAKHVVRVGSDANRTADSPTDKPPGNQN